MTHTIDANLLLYASDTGSPFHDRATELIDDMAMSPEIVYLFWPTVMAYLRIATHPAIFDRPLSHADAMANIEALLHLPNVHSTGEGEAFWRQYADVSQEVSPTGNHVPDAHLVALMLENGVRTIWTRDRDFRRFSGVVVRDPFVSG